MKKFIALLIAVVMSLTALTACSDPVFDDFENYMNVEMKTVNENYEKIRTEASTWENITENAELESSLKDTMLPLVYDLLEKLEKITPETTEVTALKDKYTKIMQAYKEGFEEMLAGVQEIDEDKLVAGNEKIDEGLKLLEEYNADLEALADETGAQIEY